MKRLLLILCFALLFTACPEKSVADRVKDTEKRVLPSGLNLWVEKDANVSPVEIAAIERGMNEAAVRAKAKGYNPLLLNTYAVVVFGNTVKGANGAYYYKIPSKGTEYENTPVDYNGYLHVSGQYLENRGDYHVIILPDYNDDNLNFLADVAGFEREHPILKFSNLPEYNRTRIHSPTTFHPLF